jgi:hydrogenase maturation factor
VIVTEEAEEICKLFKISAYSSLSEGTLLLTVKPEKTSAVQRALDLKGIRNAVIGKITNVTEGKFILTDGKTETLQKPQADPYWAAFWKAYRDGWK